MKRYLPIVLIMIVSLCSQTGEIVYQRESGIITRIIDGDTFYLEDERVRLIGINTPESYEECYNKGTEKLKELILDKQVFLEKGVLETDEYGRLLRYVFVDDIFVNLEMIRSGYAYSWKIEPDIKYSVQFEDTENYARENGIGCLWGQR